MIYDYLDKIVYYEKENITIDLSSIKFYLVNYDILELISFIVTKIKVKDVKNIIIKGDNKNSDLLKEVYFIEILKEIYLIKNDDGYKNSNLFSVIKDFSNKNEFYYLSEKIMDIFSDIGLKDDTSYLVLSSLGEIIDNSFYLVKMANRLMIKGILFSSEG